MKIKANGIRIEVEDTGADGTQNERPVVLLIMGLGMQLVAWPPALVQALVDADKAQPAWEPHWTQVGDAPADTPAIENSTSIQ